MAITNSGFASLVVGGVTGLYRINVVTGQAILIDAFGEAVVDIAIAPQPELSWEWQPPSPCLHHTEAPRRCKPFTTVRHPRVRGGQLSAR